MKTWPVYWEDRAAVRFSTWTSIYLASFAFFYNPDFSNGCVPGTVRCRVYITGQDGKSILSISLSPPSSSPLPSPSPWTPSRSPCFYQAPTTNSFSTRWPQWSFWLPFCCWFLPYLHLWLKNEGYMILMIGQDLLCSLVQVRFEMFLLRLKWVYVIAGYRVLCMSIPYQTS